MRNAQGETALPRPSRPTLVLAALVGGIAFGLFFGDYSAPLSVVGDAFVGLLQMTVLPYIVVSLIANVGKLSLSESRRLAVVGGIVLALLWATALFLVVALATSLPEWKAGSFFSTVLTEPPAQVDLLSYFIPSNIFAALSENHVPAVVVMCICAGLALSGLGERALLITQLDILARVFMRVSAFIARLTPIGVFAMSAGLAGAMSFSELARLQAYLLTYTVGAVVLCLVLLPLIVSSCTPFRYRDVLAVARVPMITAFATGKLIIVLPLLIEETDRLFERRLRPGDGEAAPAIDVLYPVAYAFPHVGKLLGLIFIPFTAWFLGNALAWDEYPVFLASGLFAYFGGPLLATPFLLDLMQLPHDMFQLFLVSGVYTGRLGDAIGAMHLVAFALLATCAFTGRVTLRLRPIAQWIAVALAAILAVVGATRLVLARSLDGVDSRNESMARLQRIDRPVEAVVFHDTSPNPDPLKPGETLLERIHRRGIVRVGFNEDKLPFAYLSQRGELVGFDVEMAHALARDLDVRIEFVRFDRANLAAQLEDDSFDVVMSGLIGTLERAGTLRHTRPYLEVTLAMVVRDHRAREFRSAEAMRRMAKLRIGFVDLSRGFVQRLRSELPRAELIELPTNRMFFEEAGDALDGLLISAESGSAFTLLYPEFEVVIPDMPRVALPLFYAIGSNDPEMREFLEHWIELKEGDGTMQELYEHWILGRERGPREPRWSVIRDVLNWVE